MKKMSKSPARGYSLSRSFGGGTRCLAGKPLFLPTKRVPVVVQSLTREQIAAIPENVFSIKVIGQEKSMGVHDVIQIARNRSPDRQMGIVVTGCSAVAGAMTMRDDEIMRGVKLIKSASARKYGRISRPIAVHRSLGGMPSGSGNSSTDPKLIAILEKFKEDCQQLQDYTDNGRPHSTDDGNGTLFDPTHIFLPVLSEAKIANAVYGVIKLYFGLNKKCVLSGKECNLAEFCLLMFIVFDRMHILVNHARKPFCVFLQKAVFMNEKTLQVKTFNNYANNPKFKSFNDSYKDDDFDLNRPPSNNAKYYELACHEIGIAFHNTEYFKQICDLRIPIQKIYVTNSK